MADNKKDNTGRGKRSGGNKSSLKPLVIGVVVVAIGFAIGLALTGGTGNYPTARGGEMRATMAPGYFFGKTAKAYKIAKEIPEVLDGIYCYCDCQKNHGHKSLLTCYVDRHGSQCSVCINEALMAHDLHNKGYEKDEIVKKVNATFSRK
jgi:hypothetical protein